MCVLITIKLPKKCIWQDCIFCNLFIFWKITSLLCRCLAPVSLDISSRRLSVSPTWWTRLLRQPGTLCATIWAGFLLWYLILHKLWMEETKAFAFYQSKLMCLISLKVIICRMFLQLPMKKGLFGSTTQEIGTNLYLKVCAKAAFLYNLCPHSGPIRSH